ncbi:glutathione peroxidase [Chlorella sorokiniana]|uniref:Glutathione peroxidase n=1 Tax=Chlorella sorokiniana TaxID=3076 RepID=A0A2P6U1V4_CHLSO|nr:glutathione peroxidase [Chlorella sorokiniana]|eukprot:PRW60284.1 glutathione peroxidase [Chlorella sorokiniana]
MAKADVNGRRSSPLVSYLKKASGDTSPLPWNYTKFLVGRDGRVYGRYLPKTRPAELEPSIRRLLAQGEDQGSGGGAAGGVPRSASGSTVRPAEHGGMVGVLVDGIGREVKEFLLHPKEDDLLPSQRAAAAAASAATAAGAAAGSSGGDAGGSQPPTGLAAAAPMGPAGEAAAAGAAAVQPAAAGGGAPAVAAAAAPGAVQTMDQQQEREHLPVLERVMREAPGEASNC